MRIPRPLTRREFISSSALLAASAITPQALAFDPLPAVRVEMGVLLYSYGIHSRLQRDKNLTDPVTFVDFCHVRGAAGVQLPLGRRNEEDSAKLRDRCAELRMYVEGVIQCPADDRDVDRFEAEIRSAKACGASVLRTVMLGGRRYEVFERAEQYRDFAMRAEKSLRLAEPIARKLDIKLAVENHKDFRSDEQAELLRKVSSEHIGVCLDTGNNIALLEDPHSVVETLAPWTMTVHIKDMGLEESRTGFLLSEVPLGQGMLDLKRIVNTVRKANPQARFNLEMITRDPLSIPCLTAKYWATLEKVPGKDLALALSLVREKSKIQPLPRITTRSSEDQLALEDDNVRKSLAFAANLPLGFSGNPVN